MDPAGQINKRSTTPLPDDLIAAMGKLSKVLLSALAVLLALVVIAAIVLALFVDPEDYRGAIADAVQTQTGRTLEIDGELSLEFWPCCGVAVGASRLGNPAGFPDTAFASVEHVGLQLQIWPLIIRQEMLIGGIRLDGLNLNLITLKNGAVNWDFAAPESDITAPVEEESTSDPLSGLSVDSIKIHDAIVSWQDATTADDYYLSDIQFETGAIEPGVPFDFSVALKAEDRKGDLSATLAVQSRLTADLDAQAISLDSLEGDLQLPESEMSAEFRLQQLNYDMESGSAVVNGFTALARVSGLAAEVTADATVSESGFSAEGSAELASFSPRELMASVDQSMETADPDVLSKADGRLNWFLKPDQLRLEEIAFNLDDTRVSGSAGIKNFETPYYTFDLNLDQIDLDRYQSPVVESDQSGTASGDEAEELPLDILRALHLDGRFKIGQLKVTGMTMSDVGAAVTAKQGVVNIDPAVASLYDGKYRGVLSLKATKSELKVTMDHVLEGVQAGALLKDFADMSELDGTLVTHINARGAGRTQPEIVKNLTGDISLDLADGVYRGVDLWHEISRARALIRRKPAPKAPDPVQTPITALSMTARISDEILTSENIIAEIPFLRMTGKGTLNLVDEALNYRFDAQVLEAPELPNGEVLSDLTGLSIPITLKGSMDAPKAGVDLKDLGKNVAEQKLKDKLLDVLGDDDDEDARQDPDKKKSTRDSLKKGLRDLLKR